MYQYRRKRGKHREVHRAKGKTKRTTHRVVSRRFRDEKELSQFLM